MTKDIERDLDVIIRMYEMASSLITPKSWKWQSVAERMYQELKRIKEQK